MREHQLSKLNPIAKTCQMQFDSHDTEQVQLQRIKESLLIPEPQKKTDGMNNTAKAICFSILGTFRPAVKRKAKRPNK